ncbi:SpnB-like Rossmann fold domain-containing protein, partial [Escherichia coli]|uniref:SpnB-like Rossmann fold domain-containing protein n=1 Tax=Escherichia coli TaxID=562 RepID=UPI0011D4D111
MLQTFSAQPRFASSTLLVLTRAAIPTAGNQIDPAASAIWGLVRSAQSEEPGRILLVDTDRDSTDLAEVVSMATAIEEPQILICDGVAHTARLTRTPTPEEADTTSDLPGAEGTVLVTG